MPRRLIINAALLLGLGHAAPALAEENPNAERGTLSLIYENDTFAATDRNYTNGIDVSYLSAPNAAPLPARWGTLRGKGFNDPNSAQSEGRKIQLHRKSRKASTH